MPEGEDQHHVVVGLVVIEGDVACIAERNDKLSQALAADRATNRGQCFQS